MNHPRETTPSSNQQIPIPEALNQAVAHHRAGQLQDAKRLYRAILQVQPKHPDANHNLGVLAVSVNQIAAALALFETARAGNPAVTQYWLSSADALVRCARPDEAQSLVAQAQSSALDEGGVQRLREYLAVHQRADSSINAPGERYQQAMQAHQSGDLQTAEAGYRQLIAQNPAHAEALHRLGLVLYQRGDPAGAEALIRRAIRNNDQVPAYHCNHGVMLQALLRLEEALQAYDQALALKPDDAQAHFNRGNALKDLGRFDDALQAYEQALRIVPQHPGTHSNRLLTLHYREARADGAILSAARAPPEPDVVVFGSFSNPTKFSARTIALWSRVLAANPEARLRLKYRSLDDPLQQRNLHARFAAAGIAPERLLLEGGAPRRAVFEAYNGVDVALDTQPYGGCTTTIEALWMGVPVVTLRGGTWPGRHATSILSTVGLPELIAEDDDGFVRIATELANDGARRARLRARRLLQWHHRVNRLSSTLFRLMLRKQAASGIS
ncbi:tetratricopeptide repeat protein [Thiorhodovibrio litoralis]|uniref:tetratricopeptide repeat protein n=1 Tax=Thiorhodovibrio litoralis TaxID=2952932 RepID=UPI002B2586F0|nr:tetratricopeptide repeat protein [Thiorhodovibrio litoralis]WPL14976.1 photosystem I assembly protein Ycf3 [Thiorhodovibrio litoralis]